LSEWVLADHHPQQHFNFTHHEADKLDEAVVCSDSTIEVEEG
jgi:hypothetical protein